MIQFLKKIAYLFFFFLFANFNLVYSFKDKVIPTDDLPASPSSVSLSNVFTWASREVFSVIMFIAVWVFVFIGIRMATARWNPEEFKKWWIHFVYAVIGLFLIFASIWIVQLVSNLWNNF